MSIKKSDAFQNQIKSINNRFYLYLSKCQNDVSCANAFKRVTGTDEDIITVTLTLQMQFLTNLTNPTCTTNLGLNTWSLFHSIASQSIELISVRPLAAILIARLYRCSAEDQRVLSRAIPNLIAVAEQSLAPSLVDPPTVHPDDGNVLSITTVWSDFVGFTLEENFKTNPSFFNDFCINSGVLNEYYLAPTGPLPVCREVQSAKYNYTIPSIFTDILYTKNPRYWGQFQVNPQIFRSTNGGALLLNGDLDYNSPMYSAQQTQLWLQSEHIRTKLIEMKGLAHVTSVQSHTKQGGFQSTTCTDQIIVQFLYQQELNLDLETINYTCSLKENLIGIDWLYSNPIVNQTLHTLFGNSVIDYWGINATEVELVETTTKSTANQSARLSCKHLSKLKDTAMSRLSTRKSLISEISSTTDEDSSLNVPNINYTAQPKKYSNSPEKKSNKFKSILSNCAASVSPKGSKPLSRVIPDDDTMSNHPLSLPYDTCGESLPLTKCKLCLQATSDHSLSCCSSAVCSSCISSYLSMHITKDQIRIFCPSCRHIFTRDEILSLLFENNCNRKLVEEYTRCYADINREEHRKTCPKCCTIKEINKDLLQNVRGRKNTPRHVICDDCQFEWCFYCHVAWHHEMTCEEYRDGEQMIRTWTSRIGDDQQNVQQCPRCKTFISKIGDCSNMSCSKCQCDFCCRCGKRRLQMKILGSHDDRYSLFGCKYNLYPEKRALRYTTRGLVAGTASLVVPLAVATGITLCAEGTAIGLPTYGTYPLVKHIHNKNRARRSSCQLVSRNLNEGNLNYIDDDGFIRDVEQRSLLYKQEMKQSKKISKNQINGCDDDNQHEHSTLDQWLVDNK
ncbi:unnamed protein product [Rotaria socialis]|uniref:RBR-type E3 ubiquitin transferase n=2 Tax=Rotaria socialis TaxID=392032 RepID=A0A818X2W6_9BILA|nr:unnamed protein product [Rotaria socialis]